MNIHSKTSPRLTCFSEICDDSKDHVKGFIHGNASSYEAYLESLIKQTPYNHCQEYKENLAEPSSKPITYSYMPETQNQEYQSFFQSPMDAVSRIYFSIKRKQMIT